MSYTFDRRKISRNNKTPDGQSAQVKREMLPNSMVNRIMEDPAAEKEADRLSQGITSSTPDDIMREMGSRLGADFSNVQFHSDANSMNKSQAMGARAWAQGRDVYFGKGGFSPSVAAHELVHTVQQGAVRGNVSQSMPMGAIQMIPNNGAGEEEEIQPNYNLKERDIRQMLVQMFTGSDMGRRIYQRIEKTMLKMIEKGTGSTRNNYEDSDYTMEDMVTFLASASMKDYSSKGILSVILQKDIRSKDNAMDAAYELEQYMDLISKRLGKAGLYDAAYSIDTSLSPSQRYNENENLRAYETQMLGDYVLDNNPNPNESRELMEVQEAINNAANAQRAYKIFAEYTGSSSGSLKGFRDLDGDALESFKRKLKHMTRVVHDYPELRNNIGSMNVLGPNAQSDTSMTAQGTVGGRNKIQLGYSPAKDVEEDNVMINNDPNLYNGPKDEGYVWDKNMTQFMGANVLGQGLASLLPNSGSKRQDQTDQNTGKIENDILTNVINNKTEYSQMFNGDILDGKTTPTKYFTENRTINGKNVLRGQINPSASNLATSQKGQSTPSAFFGEAFHDVYANGKDAKPISKAVVKEYEKQQTRLTEQKFNQKKKRSWFRKLIDWFMF